jgi:hypothetical protein
MGSRSTLMPVPLVTTFELARCSMIWKLLLASVSRPAALPVPTFTRPQASVALLPVAVAVNVLPDPVDVTVAPPVSVSVSELPLTVADAFVPRLTLPPVIVTVSLAVPVATIET